MSRARPALAACFGIALAVAIGVIAAGANPQNHGWTLIAVAGVLVVPLAVLGWFLVGALDGPTAQPEPVRRGRPRSGKDAAVAAQRELNDRASSAAWRDTVMITGAVLVVVAFVGVQWPTSYVLLGVIVVALLSQAARQIAGGREKI